MRKIARVLEGVYSNKELRRTVVPLFIGNSGLGKTKIIEGFAKKKGVKLIEFITSQMSPFEISGIAMPDKEAKKMIHYNYDRLDSLEDGDILFFDELLNGNPTVLAACLTILEGRRMISGKPLPDIMICAAANRQGMAPLTPQIKERFLWYEVSFDKSMWKKYMGDKYQITDSMGDKLASLISSEKFEGDNFDTPRSLDKAMNMILNGVHSPYENRLKPIVSELITNNLTEPIELSPQKKLEVGETISWIKLKKYKHAFTQEQEI